MKKKEFLVLAILLLAVFLTACTGEGDAFEAKSYTPEGAEIIGIDIQVADRKILVIPSDDDQLHIDYAESAKEYYEITVSDTGILTMVSKSDKEWMDYIGVRKSIGTDQITLRIPDAILSSLVLRTTQEDISLPVLTVADQLTLSNNGGDIFFENVSAANFISLENKNGNITGTITGSYDDYAITCSVKKGRSCLPEQKNGVSKTLSAINNNGNIDIEFIRE